MNLVLQLAEIEKQVSSLISENLDLKKENAKQKLKLEVLEVQTPWKDKSELIRKLTKAKDLLKRCYDTYVYEVCVRREAELKSRLKWYSEQICNKECAEVWEVNNEEQ